MKSAFEKQSKFLSFVLRHRPEAAKLNLDKDGWADISQLIANSDITLPMLYEIVRTDTKGRYALSADLTKIRANQGHSTATVDVKFEKKTPPDILYHGADLSALDDILKQGLLPMKRHYVHLSADIGTAASVGSRRKAGHAILRINSADMVKNGVEFFLSDNGVWLCKAVPAIYISI